MQTHLINLSYAKDRYQTMQNQLENLGIPFAAICAVDGKQLALPHPDFAAKSYQLMHGKEPNMGELGCYLSHIKALKALLATQHEHAFDREWLFASKARVWHVLYMVIRHNKTPTAPADCRLCL